MKKDGEKAQVNSSYGVEVGSFIRLSAFMRIDQLEE